jgi:hypothetical protein
MVNENGASYDYEMVGLLRRSKWLSEVVDLLVSRTSVCAIE